MSDKREPPPVDQKQAAAAIERLRQNIDEVDTVLVKLLNQRAKWALEIGDVKRSAGIGIYQPDREAKVVANVVGTNQGPLRADAIQRLFERIIDESRSLQRVGDGAGEPARKPGSEGGSQNGRRVATNQVADGSTPRDTS